MEERKAAGVLVAYAVLVIILALAYLVYGIVQCHKMRRNKRFYDDLEEVGTRSEEVAETTVAGSLADDGENGLGGGNSQVSQAMEDEECDLPKK